LSCSGLQKVTSSEEISEPAWKFNRRLKLRGGPMSAHSVVATPIVCQPGWSGEELDLLLGAAKFLRSAGTDLVTDHGVTDEGEPWFVFCDPENCDVLVHFARISGKYLACVPFLDRALTGNVLHDLVDRFLQSRCIVWPMFLVEEQRGELQS
jgi:hypothetical protein